MNEQRLQEALLSIARQGIPDDINLWPAIAAQVKRKILIMRLRTQPAFILLVLLVALALLTSVAYAIGRLTGFLPGAGFVETSICFWSSSSSCFFISIFDFSISRNF